MRKACRRSRGPWYIARSELIASDLDQLHISPNISKRTALDENGDGVKGRGGEPGAGTTVTARLPDWRMLLLAARQA